MRIKRAIFIAVCIKLGTFSMAAGQSKIDKDKVFNFSNFGTGTIIIAAAPQPPVPLSQFAHIEVIDVRADSLSIGFRKRQIEITRKSLQFENGLVYQFTNYIKNNTTVSNKIDAPALVLFVKDLWLKENDIDENDDDKMLDNRDAEYNFRKTALTISMDCFVRQGNNYYAALRFDTTISKLTNIPQFSKTYFDYILTVFFLKAEKIEPADIIAKKTSRSLAEITGYYNAQRQVPIFNDSTLRKGVYMNFEEFKANKPSEPDFELSKGKLADILYIGSGAKGSTPTRDAWGYCDGKYAFIKAGENYYPLVRHQHSFYFMGSTEILRNSPQSNQNNGSARVTYQNILSPLKLNWQTGKPY